MGYNLEGLKIFNIFKHNLKNYSTRKAGTCVEAFSGIVDSSLVNHNPHVLGTQSVH